MKTVLFIEDDPRSIAEYGEGLTAGGYTVEAVSSAYAAREVIARRLDEFDLLVLDLSMLPTADMPSEQVHSGLGTGVMLFQDVRRRRPALPVIVLTNVFSSRILGNLPKDEPGRYKLLNKIDTLPEDLTEEVTKMLFGNAVAPT